MGSPGRGEVWPVGLLCRRSSANLPVPLCGTHSLTKRSVLWHGRLSPEMALFLTNSERQSFSKWALLMGSPPMLHVHPPPLHPPITHTPNDTKDVILTDVNRRNTLSTQPDWKKRGERGYCCAQKFVGIWNNDIFVIVLNALKPLYFYCRNSGGCNYLNTSNIKTNNLMNEIMWSLRFIGVKPVIPGMHFWFRQGRHLIKIKAIIHWCPLKRQDLS